MSQPSLPVAAKSQTDKVKQALAVAPQSTEGLTLKAMLQSTDVRGRFEDMLGKKAAGFISSILSAVSLNKALGTADPRTVLSAAAIAASLDLPINGNIGFAYIVPYKGQAQFQLG